MIIYIYNIDILKFTPNNYQRKFCQETSKLRTILTASCRTIMSTTSFCQSHHHVLVMLLVVGKCERAERMNSRLKRLSGAKPCYFSGGCPWSPPEGIYFRDCAPRSGKLLTKYAHYYNENSIYMKENKKYFENELCSKNLL